jgi:phospholipase/carboxylesterase
MTAAPSLDGPRVAPRAGGPARRLIVLLHGLGADGDDLIALAPVLGEVFADAAFVAPHAPFACDMAPMGYQWFSLQQLEPQRLFHGAEAVRGRLDRFLDDELARHGLTPEHLALVGFSQGTMMALHTALRRAVPLAGIVGFSGMLVGAERLAAEIVSRPPVLLIHGEADPVVPFEMMAAAEHVLAGQGVSVAAHARAGLGHGIDPGGLALAVRFLQSCFAPAAER